MIPGTKDGMTSEIRPVGSRDGMTSEIRPEGTKDGMTSEIRAEVNGKITGTEDGMAG